MIACTRASTLAKALDAPGDGLMDYASATTVQTLLANDDLMTRALLVDPAGGWRGYKPVVAEAKNRRGKVEASEGTNIHSVVEAIVTGRDVGRVPDEVLKPARLVLDELESLGVTVRHTEMFVAALDRWTEPVAGTADLVLEYSGELFVADIKTTEVVGKNTRYSAMAWAAQTTCYAYGVPHLYEPQRDRWGRPLVDPERGTSWGLPMNLGSSIIIEVARDGSDVASHEIDLDEGLVALACQVRAARKKERVARW